MERVFMIIISDECFSGGGCPDGFFLARDGSDICYYVSSLSETYRWEDAKIYCENKSASLAQLKTTSEYNDVSAMMVTYGMSFCVKNI